MRFRTERQMQANVLLKDGDYKSIRDMLGRIARIKPEDRMLAELDKDSNIIYWNSREIYEEVMNLGDGLLSEGLGGAHIAIVADNCCRYVIADMTISSGVGVVTPIDVEAPQSLLEELLSKYDADAVLCSTRVLEKVRQAAGKLSRVKTLITIDAPAEGTLYYTDIVEKGRTKASSSIYRNIELDLDAPAKILFTSGTTGANKGVVLTNANLAANILNCMDVIMAEEVGNTAMSILPMHHATEINTHVMARMGSGRLTYINGSMRDMMANMKIFKPRIITIVPMIANAFYKTIWATARRNGKEEKLRKGIKISNFLRKFGIDITHKMFAEIYAPFGGNLKMIVCGGSMLNPVTIKGLNDIGIRLENGYGITECGPLISMNADTLNEHLSVGKPCPSLEAKILNPDGNGVGELCIRGKSVSSGYYKDPEATAAVFGKDGFFNTGDSAKIDEKGQIILMGRKKNTIVLPSGKNICPEEVENILETAIPYADDIAVYQADYKAGGCVKKILCAGLFISDEAKRAAHEEIISDVKAVNETLPAYKRVDFVELPSTAYEKTSSKKIKRAALPTECSPEGLTIN
jgi:Long-chain acyl-CoA synthetases (AMP-forming)